MLYDVPQCYGISVTGEASTCCSPLDSELRHCAAALSSNKDLRLVKQASFHPNSVDKLVMKEVHIST